MELRARLGVSHPKLLAVIGEMDKRLEHPVSCAQLARTVRLSPRQLERLFVRYLKETPSRHYMKVRLERARAMLLQTTKPVLDVAVASGFTSASHFSRCYRATYGRKPSDERAGLRQ